MLFTQRVVIAVLLSLFSLVLPGCKSAIDMSVVVDADGSGEIAVGIRVDQAANRALRQLTGKSFAEAYALTDVASAGWTVNRTTADQGWSGFVVRKRFENPGEAGPLLQSISGKPPVVLEALELRRSEDLLTTSFDLAMTVNLDRNAVSDTLAASIGKAEYSRLSSEYAISVTDSISAEVRVVLPGKISASNADSVSGGALEWSVRGGERKTLTAASSYFQWPYVAGAIATGAAAILLAVLLVGDVRRRGGRHGADAAEGSKGEGHR